MNKKITEIFKECSEDGILTEMRGADGTISKISPVEKSGPGDLVFVEKKDYIPHVLKNKPSAAVIPADLYDLLKDSSCSALFSPNVSLAQALMKQKYMDRDLYSSEWENPHPSAVIHKSAEISKTAVIGPGAVIGKDVRIGEKSVIMANSVIEYGASIGKYSVIHPGVIIGFNTLIGDRVIIKSNSVIGSEGFGFAQDEKRRSHRIPQTGRVVIEDDVVIGAGNCIDRAAYEETKIGRGTKFDNLCHVAHNVRIGEDCLLTAGFVVAGSTKIGNRVIASGQTGILDHLNIVDDCIFVHRAGVTENVEQSGIYAGLPILPLKVYMKNTAIFRKLDELRKSVMSMERKISDAKK